MKRLKFTIPGTFCLLLFLLAGAVGLHYLPAFPGKLALVLLVAAVKAVLVVFVFMRATETRGATPFYIVAGFVWLALLFMITFADYATR